MSERVDMTYRCSTAILWVRELDHTRVMDTRTGSSHRLVDLEAVIWDLVALRYAERQVIAFLVPYLDCSIEQARARLHNTLADWCELGILERVEPLHMVEASA